MAASWIGEPPYSPPSDTFQPKLQGQCHCGQVKYLLSRDTPLASKYCHCDDCKLIHGAPFQWAAIFHKTDVAFVDLDAPHLQFYNSTGEGSDGEQKPPLPCKVRCSRCGTLLFDEGRNMVLLFPTTLQFTSERARRNFDVQCHIFYPARDVDIPDGKPKWTGLDGKSRLMEEP